MRRFVWISASVLATALSALGLFFSHWGVPLPQRKKPRKAR